MKVIMNIPNNNPPQLTSEFSKGTPISIYTEIVYRRYGIKFYFLDFRNFVDSCLNKDPADRPTAKVKPLMGICGNI